MHQQSPAPQMERLLAMPSQTSLNLSHLIEHSLRQIKQRIGSTHALPISELLNQIKDLLIPTAHGHIDHPGLIARTNSHSNNSESELLGDTGRRSSLA